MRVLKTILLAAIVSVGLSFTTNTDSRQMKCLVQLINYEGEGAYIIVSVVDKDGNYLNTLKVLGDDPEWYHEIDSWWSYYGRKRYKLDGITGATIGGGERSVFQLSIDEAYFTNGNKLRFETAVEEQDYHQADAEIELAPDLTTAQADGTGYIRYVRLIGN